MTKEKVKSLGWEHCSFTCGYEVLQHPECDMIFAFRDGDKYGIFGHGCFIHCDLTEAELEEYTRLAIGITKGKDIPDAAAQAEAQQARAAMREFVERMWNRREV